MSQRKGGTATAEPGEALTRLGAAPQTHTRLSVDRAHPGAIRNVAVITTGPALGHGIDIDRTTVEQVASALSSRVRGRWTHGKLSADGLGEHLGSWSTGRVEDFWLCRECDSEVPDAPLFSSGGAESERGPACCGGASERASRAVADFRFSASAWKLQPDGLDVPAPDYLMERAEEDPGSLGISIVAYLGHEVRADNEGEESKPIARLLKREHLKRGDWVADPAANPIGLHAGTDTASELTEGAQRVLDRLMETLGPEETRRRALAFLDRTLPAEPTKPEKKMAKPASPVTAAILATSLGAAGPEDTADSLRAKLAARDEHISALKARITVLEDAEEKRLDDEREDYLLDLQERAVAFQSPIPEDKLQRVGDLMKNGMHEEARDLGEALLALAEAKSSPRGVPASRKRFQVLGAVEKTSDEDMAALEDAAAEELIASTRPRAQG